ncbi:MAG: hypothetical protein D3903_11400 [Candidatus Electrothrix sp. GM3_4]|nr:hypothetical protein [Candidatus Electrothrix sp. GM3_4]
MNSGRLFNGPSLVTIILLLGVSSSGSAFAQSDYEQQPVQHVFSVAGRFGLGGMVNSVNYGAGPTAEYWFTEHVGAMCTLGATGDFKTTSLRGHYMFNSLVVMSSFAMRPYLGIGYAHVEADRTHGGIYFEAEEDGFEGYAGIMHNARWLHENLFFRGEMGLSAYDMALPDDDLSNVTANFGVSLLF